MGGLCRDGINDYSCQCLEKYVAVGHTCTRFRDNGDGTIYDASTGYTWQKNVEADRQFNWNDAKTYCSLLALAGGGWVIPTVEELTTLVDTARSPTINLDYFPNTIGERYWTGSPEDGPVGGMGDGVYFVAGYSNKYPIESELRVRCRKR
jgi:hypothetical protein